MPPNPINEWAAWEENSWRSWIDERINERKTVFLTAASDMVGAYNREQASARDYYGRELLELLQNADDAGAEILKKNQVLIKLTENALYVANTGLPFSPAGVESLMVSDNSPKQLSRTRLIGYKGLGFRSVLGWSSSIVILSGSLRIGFTKRQAINNGEILCRKNEKLRTIVDSFRSRTDSFPVPTLAFPFWLDNNFDGGDEIKEVFDEANTLLKKGFDTVIGFSFNNKSSTNKLVQKQIQSLGIEILLFSNFIEGMEIQSPLLDNKWDADREGNKIVIGTTDGNTSLWELYESSGQIPREYIGQGQPIDMMYNVRIAVPDQGIGHDRLFVYFPTAVLFPFPIVAHSTFELAGNRQNLIESDVNRFVSEQLAYTMANAAEHITTSNSPWKGLEMVTPRGQLDPILQKLGFLQHIKDSCTGKQIIPVRRKKFHTPQDSKLLNGDFNDLLTSREFDDICLWSDNRYINDQLRLLEIEYISNQELCNCLNQISSSLTIRKRAKLIRLVIDNHLIEEGAILNLLVDESETIIPSGKPTYLPPEEKELSIPKWVPIRFLNNKLVKALREEFGVSRNRDISAKLRILNVQEYNLNSILSAILTATNRRIKKSPDREIVYRQQMLSAIYNMFTTIDTDESPLLTQRLNIVVATSKGGFKPAGQLYFSKEYECGERIDNLLCNLDVDLFVGNKEVLGLSAETEDIENFLRWLGVEALPRFGILERINSSDFKEHVISSLNFPARFGDVIAQGSDYVRSNSPLLNNIQVFEYFENILENADPHAILAWIAIDNRIETLRLEGDQGARLSIWPPYKQHGRALKNQVLPSYIIWLLRNSNWLPTFSGKKTPVECCSARGIPKELSQIIGIPAINFQHPLFDQYGVDRIAIQRALSTTGVVSDIQDITGEIYYGILSKLPDIDPTGNIARSLYRLFIGRNEGTGPVSGKMQDEFFEKGRMYGKLGDEFDYFPLEKLNYIENFTLPGNIARFFHLLELDRRRGAGKVKRLFNVNSLSSETIENRIEIKSFVEHPLNELFQSEVERLKSLIYALRISDDSDRSELKPLRRLTIVLCKSVEAGISLTGEQKIISLDKNDSIKYGQTSYLVAEPVYYDKPILSDSIIADAVGEIISNILSVDLNSDIARLASCEQSQRLALLDRMVGGSSNVKVEEAQALLSSEVEEELPVIAWPHPSEQPPQISEDEHPSQPIGVSSLPSSHIGDIEIHEMDPIVVESSINTRTTSIRQSNPRPGRTRRTVNPDRAENLALKFEEEQNRFPVKVSDIRGVEGYGCDLISFKSDTDRELFKEDPDPSLVIRYIEVKGRTSRKGSIPVAGNELGSAQKNKDRYFIYRIYEDKDNRGSFELVELRDPLGCDSNALKPVYEVHPFRTDRSQFWEVKEIPSE